MNDFDVHHNAAEMHALFAARHQRLADEFEKRGDSDAADRARRLADRQLADAGRQRTLADAA